MTHGQFRVDAMFWCGGNAWRCTDIGGRVIVAIRLGSVDVQSTELARCQTLSRAQAEADGWFEGPPYAVCEVVFDEDGIGACSLEPERQTDALAEGSELLFGELSG